MLARSGSTDFAPTHGAEHLLCPASNLSVAGRTNTSRSNGDVREHFANERSQIRAVPVRILTIDDANVPSTVLQRGIGDKEMVFASFHIRARATTDGIGKEFHQLLVGKRLKVR